MPERLLPTLLSKATLALAAALAFGPAHAAAPTGDAGAGEVDLFGPDNWPPSQLISPSNIDISIPSGPPNRGSNSFLHHCVVNRSHTRADGSTQQSRINVFECRHHTKWPA